MVPISLVSPGFMGLNKQAEASILPPIWATEAINCVFDSAGRLAARKGITMLSETPVSGSPTIEQIGELLMLDGTTEVVFSTSDDKIYGGTGTPADITGTATVTEGNDWQFVNFNGELYGFQQGEDAIYYDGATAFADLTAASGTVPDGNVGFAFAGRLWGSTEDGQVLKYSALLDATHWTTGAGSFDFTSVWPTGADSIVAAKVYNGQIVVFGSNNILFLADPEGNELGLDPTNAVVVDTISGIGCIARDTVQEIEGADLLFLSAAGIQSLSKLIQEKSNPINNVSKNVRDYLKDAVAAETKIKIKGVYSPENSFYLLSCPATGKSFCLDTSARLPDGTFRVTEWTLAPAAVVRGTTGTVYLAVDSVPGIVGEYSGYLDNDETYQFVYSSPWLDLGEEIAQYIKILKNLTATVYAGSLATISLKWDIDFSGVFQSITGTAAAAGGAAEYGEAEYGEDEYGTGSISLNRINGSAYGAGQFYRVGIQTVINNTGFAAQQLNMFTKIGRLAK